MFLICNLISTTYFGIPSCPCMQLVSEGWYTIFTISWVLHHTASFYGHKTQVFRIRYLMGHTHKYTRARTHTNTHTHTHTREHANKESTVTHMHTQHIYRYLYAILELLDHLDWTIEIPYKYIGDGSRGARAPLKF